MSDSSPAFAPPPPPLFGTPREWAQDLALATVIGVFLGVIGPFGSFYGGAIEIRIAYWTANMWIGFATLSMIVRAAVRAAMRFDVPVWFSLTVGVAFGSAPLGLLVGLFSAWFWPGNHGRLSSIGVLYGQTVAIAEPVSLVYYWLGARKGVNPPLFGSAQDAGEAAPDVGADHIADAQPEAAPDDVAFLRHLPPRLGRDLLALQMEDHYVRVHTAKGSDLVLTPLKDAIAELGDTPGMQVHRSWWVAEEAVTAPLNIGRNLFLRLANGLEVPVSRPTVAKLKAAGWLEKK